MFWLSKLDFERLWLTPFRGKLDYFFQPALERGNLNFSRQNLPYSKWRKDGAKLSIKCETSVTKYKLFTSWSEIFKDFKVRISGRTCGLSDFEDCISTWEFIVTFHFIFWIHYKMDTFCRLVKYAGKFTDKESTRQSVKTDCLIPCESTLPACMGLFTKAFCRHLYILLLKIVQIASNNRKFSETLEQMSPVSFHVVRTQGSET